MRNRCESPGRSCGQAIPTLALMLTQLVGRPIVDKTDRGIVQRRTIPVQFVPFIRSR